MIIEGLMMVLIIILAIKLWSCETRLDLINEEVEDWIADTREFKQRCDGHKELIEALSKSVRELNGVVEAAVRVKEETSDNKPDTKALIGGWTTDDGRTEIDASHISTGTIEMGVDWAIHGSDRTGFIKHPCEGCPTPVIGCADCSFF